MNNENNKADEQAKEATAKENVQFVNVRGFAEHANGQAAGTINLPLNTLSRENDRLNPELPTYILCQGGYRSSLGMSILENAGFQGNLQRYRRYESLDGRGIRHGSFGNRLC